jgi:hypothetical protein
MKSNTLTAAGRSGEAKTAYLKKAIAWHALLGYAVIAAGLCAIYYMASNIIPFLNPLE